MLLSEIGGKTTANLLEIGGKHPSEFRGNGENRHFKFRGNGIFQRKPLWHSEVTKTAKKRHKIPSPLAGKRRAACQPRAPPAPSPEPLYLTHFNHRQKLYQMNLALDAAGLFYQAIGKFQIVVHPPFRRTLDIACIDIETAS